MAYLTHEELTHDEVRAGGVTSSSHSTSSVADVATAAYQAPCCRLNRWVTEDWGESTCAENEDEVPGSNEGQGELRPGHREQRVGESK